MNPERLLSELLAAARKLGLGIRVEPFDTGGTSPGGLCKVEGRYLLLIDAAAPLLEQAAAAAGALAALDHESVYVAPEARKLIYAAGRLRKRSVDGE